MSKFIEINNIEEVTSNQEVSFFPLKTPKYSTSATADSAQYSGGAGGR